MVAVMTEALMLQGTERVLEIGTGSGYQAAILAELAAEVITIERRPELADDARTILGSLGYSNVEVMVGDGTLGLAARAPFDRILVTAGAPRVPEALTQQLSPDGGRLVIPVGSSAQQVVESDHPRRRSPRRNHPGGVRFRPAGRRGCVARTRLHLRSVRLQADRRGPAKAGHYVNKSSAVSIINALARVY
jgi:protein-L-isoaspartate(D-aspartate) O-methyltransferase